VTDDAGNPVEDDNGDLQCVYPDGTIMTVTPSQSDS
jgi:hypothetical protein